MTGRGQLEGEGCELLRVCFVKKRGAWHPGFVQTGIGEFNVGGNPAMV